MNKRVNIKGSEVTNLVVLTKSMVGAKGWLLRAKECTGAKSEWEKISSRFAVVNFFLGGGGSILFLRKKELFVTDGFEISFSARPLLLLGCPVSTWVSELWSLLQMLVLYNWKLLCRGRINKNPGVNEDTKLSKHARKKVLYDRLNS